MRKINYSLFVCLTLLSFALKAQNYGLVFNNNIYVNITNSVNLVIDNPNASAITVVNSGNIISEGEYNVVKWNIGTNTGTYKVPFTSSLASGLVKIPLEMNVTSAGAGAGTVLFSTFETTNDDNTAYPSDVANMNSNCNNNNGLYAVDRFWRIDAQNYTTKPTPVLSFGYNPNANETGVTNTIAQSALKAERFNATAASWETPQKLYGLANTTNSVVAGVSVSPADFHKSWTLIDTTIMTFTVTALSQTICAGTQAVITPTGGTTYTLMPGTLTSSTNFSLTPTTLTTYTISGTIGTGTATCKSIPATNATPTVIVNATPTVAISGSSVICSGNSATLTVSSANTYSWSNGTTNSTNIVSPTTNTLFVAIGTNTYASGSCTAIAIYSVNVNATPTVAISGTSVVCSGNAVTLNALTANSYSWSNNATASANTFTPATSGTYSVVGTNTYVAGNCTSTAFYSVTVNATPTIAISGSSVICSGNSTTLTATTANGYIWSNGTLTSANVVSPTTNTVFAAVGTNTYASGSCTAIAIYSVNVNATPTVAISGTSVVCSGFGITLNALTANTYSWSNNATTAANTFTPATSGTFSVVGTNTYVAGNCSSLPASFSVTVNANPTVTIVSNTLCAGSSAVLTASANPAAGSTYSWSQGGITTNSISVNPTTNTNYTVTAFNNGCSGSAVATATVYAVGTPTTGFFYNSPVCIAATNPLPTPVTGFAANGVYSSNAGLTINGTTGEINLAASTAGTYVVTYSLAPNGCTSAGSSTTTVVIQSVPSQSVASFSFNSPICKDNSSTTTSVIVGGTYNGGEYSATPAGLSINNLSGEIDLSTSAAGVYTVNYAYVGVVTCNQTYTGQTTVTIIASPTITASSDVTINYGSSTVLTATSSPNTYTWYPTTNLSCSNCDSPVASPSVTTNYCVKTVDGVCSNSVCLKVIVENPCPTNNLLSLPNAFSPNGDGSNDVYCFQGWNCVSAFSILIFDRWGEKIFETTDPSACWDGTYKGKLLDPAVFVYYAKATFNNGTSVDKKGNITLIK